MIELRGTPREGLWGATLGFLVGFAAVALFGPTAQRFKEIMDLSPLMVGLLVAMPALSGSLLRIPFAAWVDTTGGRKPFLVLLILSIVGMTGLLAVVWAFYPDRLTVELYPLLLLLGLLCGCGIATFSVGIGQVSYWFPQSKQGAALGTYAGLGNLAPGVFSFLLPVALVSWGLSGAYLAWLLFLVAGAVLYAWLGRPAWYFQFKAAGLPAEEARHKAQQQGQEHFPAGSLVESLMISARTWKTWALVGVYFTSFGGFIALTAWLPTYWAMLFGLGETSAGSLTALYSIGASLIRVFGGGIADRIGGEKTALLALVAMLLGALAMVFADQVAVAVVGEILLALGMGVTNAAVFKLVPREIPQAVGGAAGWIGGLGAFGGFAIPPVMGAIVDVQGIPGYANGFVVFVVLAVLSAGLIWLVAASHRKKAARALAGAPPIEMTATGNRAETPDARPSVLRSLLGSSVTTAVLSVGLIFALFIFSAAASTFRLPGNHEGFEPDQPIAFSHQVHAGDLGIDCLYCHSDAETSRLAGIPAADTCMNCHDIVTDNWATVRAENQKAEEESRPPRQTVSPELQKLYDYLALDDQLEPIPGATAQPIPWVRIHDLPDFVYFDHRAHVQAGVNCQDCHGPVETMVRVRQVESLSMGWCVDCHRQVNREGVLGQPVDASLDCSACHY